MRADGSGEARLTNNQVSDTYSDWSPDGRHIVFTSFRDDNYELYAMTADGSDPTRLTNNQVLDYTPDWLP